MISVYVSSYFHVKTYFFKIRSFPCHNSFFLGVHEVKPFEFFFLLIPLLNHKSNTGSHYHQQVKLTLIFEHEQRTRTP